MKISIIWQLIIYFTLLFALAFPLGKYIYAVMEGKLTHKYKFIAYIDSFIFKYIDKNNSDMSWLRYTSVILIFNFIGFCALFLLQKIQHLLPLNQFDSSNISNSPLITNDSAFNTAISFVTNTNWQGYAGESTMSYFTQMLGLGVQNFLSAATGIAVVFALIRGFIRDKQQGIGNAWLDLYRANIWILLPISAIFAIFLVGQGVIQNFNSKQTVQLIQPFEYTSTDNRLIKVTTQDLPMGSVASQEAIKIIGTNGGGFFNANSSHPFENPNALTNFMQMLGMLLIPTALVFAFGHMVGNLKQSLAILASMSILLIIMLFTVFITEMQSLQWLANLGVDVSQGNLEGKEQRFGVLASSMFAVLTTATSTGAVNSMHDSFMPLSGGILMWLMQLGEVVFGGVGSGLYGMLVFAMLAVFLSGLMIGRTPEYLGKKIGVFEIKMLSIIILITPLLVLGGTALAVLHTEGLKGILNQSMHGFSEVLYAFTSAANNNGSAFAGLSVNTPFYNILLGFIMLIGRFGTIIPILAIAGSLAKQKNIQPSLGTMPTHGILFVILLIAVILIVGALTYIPALALGPIAEHLSIFNSGVNHVK